ncbi:MAG: hypothetical protein IPI58_05085 [Alphaproteobacteria bacterium]|nr:MAG: hypothetical protein IPI58_05085 [Alphaproteobacteria bacterium]
MKTVMESLVAVRDAIPQQDKQPGGPHHDFNQQVSDLLTALREIKAPANADPTKKLSAYARVMARLAQLRQSWGAHSNVEDAYKLIDEALSSMLSPAVPHQNAAAPTPHTRPASQAGIGASSSSPGAQPGISGPLGANSLNGGYLRNPPYHGNPSAPEWQAHRATHETWATVIGSIMQETPPGYSTVPFDQSCFYTLDLADPKPHNTAIHVRIQSESPGLSQSKMAVLQHSFGANGYQSLDLLPSPEGEPEYPREIRDHALKLMVGYVVDRFDTWTVGGSRSVDLRGSDIERATMRKMMEGQLAQRYQGDELKKRVALIKDVTDAPPAPQPASRAWAVRPSKERGLPPILTPPVPA